MLQSHDKRWELVGINTAIFSQSGGYQGIGFAVPSNLARRVVTELQQFVIDYRGGANGIIAMRAGARAAPDGYTLVFANSSTTTITLALHANAGYEPLKEFMPIGMPTFMRAGRSYAMCRGPSLVRRSKSTRVWQACS